VVWVDKRSGMGR